MLCNAIKAYTKKKVNILNELVKNDTLLLFSRDPAFVICSPKLRIKKFIIIWNFIIKNKEVAHSPSILL